MELNAASGRSRLSAFFGAAYLLACGALFWTLGRTHPRMRVVMESFGAQLPWQTRIVLAARPLFGLLLVLTIAAAALWLAEICGVDGGLLGRLMSRAGVRLQCVPGGGVVVRRPWLAWLLAWAVLMGIGVFALLAYWAPMMMCSLAQ